jgi:hypothetical protein
MANKRKCVPKKKKKKERLMKMRVFKKKPLHTIGRNAK